MRRERVSSSSIGSLGYDRSSSTMEVEFKDGRIYQYFDVPEVIFREFLTAPSIGSFFQQNVRGQFVYSRL
jgi:hypothetical protein